MKVGLLGGTFNPPHLGHLRLAEEVASLHGLHRVIFIPCFIPPHKASEHIPAPFHRLEMTRLACQDNPLFEISDIEVRRGNTSYTVNTLEYFSGIADRESYFLIGTDSLREIRTWKDSERLFPLSHFIVVTRPGLEFEAAWSEVPADLRAEFEIRGGHYEHRSGTRLIASEVVGLDVSSTRIRALGRAGRSIRYLVPEAVRAYIVQNDLYRC